MVHQTMAVVFYEPDAEDDRAALKRLELIDDDCAKFEINFVKLRDAEAAREYGIDDMPGLLYFENREEIQQTKTIHISLNFFDSLSNLQNYKPPCSTTALLPNWKIALKCQKL